MNSHLLIIRISYHINQILSDTIVIEILCFVYVQPRVDLDCLRPVHQLIGVVPLVKLHNLTFPSDEVNSVLADWRLKQFS